MTFLLLTVRFLDDRYHGLLADSGPPEWPPSPFRFFCALVAGLARRGELEGDAGKALTWLQRLDPPIIIAPKAKTGQAITRYVPNNDGDKRPDRQDRLGTKPTIPTLFLLPPNQNPEVHYVWKIPETSAVPVKQIRTAARSLTALGWGIDMAFADARLVSEAEIQRLSGIRWRPVASEENESVITLRVPTADDELQESTLEDLKHCHQTAMQRIEQGKLLHTSVSSRPTPRPRQMQRIKQGKLLHTVEEPRVFDRVIYTADIYPTRPLAAFEIQRTIEDQEANPGRSRFRPFHPVRRVAAVAGMVRHAAAQAARTLGYADSWVNEHILGHSDGKHGQATSDERLMFLPLPSIQKVVGVGGIRRVLIVGWPGFDRFADLRRRLHGAELIPEDSLQPLAVLSQLSTNDAEVQKFLEPSQTWTTVTPVILPGFDDRDGLRRRYRQRAVAGQATAAEQRHLLERLNQRITALLWKAFEQAGWSPDALAGAQLEYRRVGWLRGLESARSYALPKVDYPRYHVRVRFPRPVRGPLAIGAGRYRGLGLFARTD